MEFETNLRLLIHEELGDHAWLPQVGEARIREKGRLLGKCLAGSDRVGSYENRGYKNEGVSGTDFIRSIEGESVWSGGSETG